MIKNKRLFYKLVSLLVVSFFVVLAILEVPSTNAFLKTADNKEVLSPIGDLKVELNDTNQISDLTIGSLVDRTVTVENKTDTNMFVRLLIHPVLESKDGVYKPVSVEEVIPTISSDWIAGNDGYYYYKSKLESRDETPPVFEKVTTSANMEEEDTFKLLLKVEATTAKGDTYKQAWWEGKEPGDGSLKQVDDSLKGLKD